MNIINDSVSEKLFINLYKKLLDTFKGKPDLLQKVMHKLLGYKKAISNKINNIKLLIVEYANIVKQKLEKIISPKVQRKRLRDEQQTIILKKVADDIFKEVKALTSKSVRDEMRTEFQERVRHNELQPKVINDYEMKSKANLSNEPLELLSQDDFDQKLYRHCQTVLTENDMKFIDLWYQGIDKARDQAEILGINTNVAYEERRKIKSILARTLPNYLK